MDLDKFTKTIEFEVHGIHELSTETVLKIFELIKSEENSTYDKDENIKPNLKPFDKVLINTINHSLIDLKENIRKKIISNITINGAHMFPNNVNIYLTYALIEIKRNKQEFINKILKDSIQIFSFKKDVWLKIFIYFGLLLLIIGLIILTNDIIKSKNRKRNPNIYDVPL